ncbi:OmpH family outer membrane protein [Hephaestia mangrovi]|uniref:OmpH family outer membrane protein n=1 Tax=Hephaestia mangrovi TaxID=2873268 RepID=UPI001CA72905|nr:OmpH family outer membrane protein [Hephaestia mangrovi]MBY8827908.1 OmpH family outer membrane protein [Hephaestia mangrovi]
MTNISKLVFAAAIAAPGLIAAAAPASAQSVAVLDPDAAIANSNAWKTAAQTIQTTYKAQIAQVQARQTALANEIKTSAAPLDTNKDGQISQAELQAAQTSNPNAVKALQAKEQSAQQELQRMSLPFNRAKAYAIEQISGHEDDAVSNVVKQRKIAVLLRPEATFVADPSADVTSAVTAELDRLITAPVSVTPPANWQPGQQQQQAAPAAPAANPSAPAGR